MRLGLADRNDYEDQVNRKLAGPKYWKTLGALVSNLPEAQHSTTWIGDRAIRTLEQWDAAGPNLLMVGFIKPHHPFDPPAPWNTMYDPAKLTLPPGWTDRMLERDLRHGRGFFPCDEMTEAQFRRALAYYYAGISHIDQQVGRMVEVLRRRGLYDNTLIVYTSDHGDHMGYHHMILKGNYTYDSIAKVPLIIKWPGGRGAGTTSTRMVNNIDLAPTFCRAAGCAPGAKMPGQDLAAGGPSHELIYCGRAMVRSRTRKLMTGPGRKIVFIDLEKDPLEMTDVSDDPAYAAEIKFMQDALQEYLSRGSRQAYVDENAPQIRGPNVPPDLGHRPAIQKYFADKVKALEAPAS